MSRHNDNQIGKTFLYFVLLVCLMIRLGVSSLPSNTQLNPIHGNRLVKTWQFFKKLYEIKRSIAGHSKTDSLPYDPESSMTAVTYSNHLLYFPLMYSRFPKSIYASSFDLYLSRSLNSRSYHYRRNDFIYMILGSDYNQSRLPSSFLLRGN